MESLLITDTSVLLNILATDCAERILTDSGWQFSVCESVVAETVVLRNRETRESRPIDLSPLLHNGMLQMLALETDAEFELLVDYSALIGRGGETEAMCFALAEGRSLPVAIDDERAVKRARRRFSGLATITTPEILMRWQERTRVPPEEMSILLQRIHTWANYLPGRNHPCHKWWHTVLFTAAP
jgi:hypothetical protein